MTGTVLHMTDSDVIVDVGYKSEGIIPLDEFRDVDGNVRVREGDEIDVLVQRADNRRGHLVLSHRKAEKMKVWNQIEDAFEKQTPVRGRVVDRIRGGLEVDIGEIGVRGFLPGSQVDLRPVRNLGSYKGRELEFAGHQAEQAPGQHRAFAPGGPGRRENQDPRGARGRARVSGARSATSPNTAPSWTSAGSAAFSTSGKCPSAGWSIPRSS